MSIVTGNANTTVLLVHTHDRTCHRTVRRSYQFFVEQVLDLAVDLRLECVWYTVGTHLPRHEPVGGLDSMHHRVASPGSVVELAGELVEQLAKLLSLIWLKVRDLIVLDSLTRQQTLRHNRYGG